MRTLDTHLRCSGSAHVSAHRPCRAASRAVRLRHILLVAVGTLFCVLKLSAQTLDSRTAEEPNQSWTATSDQQSNDSRSTSIVESHSQNGNLTLDRRSVEIRGLDGQIVHWQDIEKETLQLDAATVRTTTRTFGRDVNGSKTLVQVTEEERHTEPGGNSHAVRTTSDPDINGTLQPVQREIVETKKIDTNVEETKTTVMLPNINGGLAAVLETDELRKRGANDTIESTKTTLLADGAGSWQVGETQQTTTKQDANTRSAEERVFRRDAEGKLSEVSHVVTKESESSSGEKHKLVETYSVDVPGTTQDGNLHLIERATTTQHTSATGEHITQQQVEQPNRGNPEYGLGLSILIDERVVPGDSSEQATRTISVRDSNGSFGVVSVDTSKSDRVPTLQVEQTP